MCRGCSCGWYQMMKSAAALSLTIWRLMNWKRKRHFAIVFLPTHPLLLFPLVSAMDSPPNEAVCPDVEPEKEKNSGSLAAADTTGNNVPRCEAQLYKLGPEAAVAVADTLRRVAVLVEDFEPAKDLSSMPTAIVVPRVQQPPPSRWSLFPVWVPWNVLLSFENGSPLCVWFLIVLVLSKSMTFNMDGHFQACLFANPILLHAFRTVFFKQKYLLLK